MTGRIECHVLKKNKLLHWGMFLDLWLVFKEYDTYIHFNILEKGTHDKELRGEQRVDLEAGLDQDSTSSKENSEEETQNQSQTQTGPDAAEESEPTNYDGMFQSLHEKTNLKLALLLLSFIFIY